MTFRPHPTKIVNTPLGELRVWATSTGHIGVATAGNLNVERKPGEEQKSVSVNGVDLTLRMDFTIPEITGSERKRWAHEVTSEWVINDTHDLMMKRAEPWTLKEASEAARRKTLKVMSEWFVGFLQSEDGKALLAEVDHKVKADRLDAVRERLAKIEAESEALAAEKFALEAELFDRVGDGVTT